MAPGDVSPKWTHYDIHDDPLTAWPKKENGMPFQHLMILTDLKFNGTYIIIYIYTYNVHKRIIHNS